MASDLRDRIASGPTRNDDFKFLIPLKSLYMKTVPMDGELGLRSSRSSLRFRAMFVGGN